MSYNPIRFGSLQPDERWRVYTASQMSLNDASGRDARLWLTRERSLDSQTISDFRLGFVPHHVDHAFSGRIVIPIFDSYNNLLALSVRPATSDPEIIDKCGKYWNESYEKGWQLFGLNAARMSIVQMGFVIIVEGQFDVMAMHSFGFTNTVGVLGGAFTPMQAELLKRWTRQIVLMFDGDNAGREHNQRCLNILNYYGWTPMSRKTKEKEGGFRTINVALPADKDPNDFLKRYGSWPMRKTITDAMRMANMQLPEGY